MSRTKQPESATRKKIVAAALKLFLEAGYEGTAVRRITEEAGVAIGSFYHFFGSKEQLFEASVEQFLRQYAQHFLTIAGDDSLSSAQRLGLLLGEMEKSTLHYFGPLQGNRLHWTMQYALHARTMQLIAPGVKHMVEEAIADGSAVNRLGMDTETLAAVVLQGIEGIVHAKPLDAVDQAQMLGIRADVIRYVTFVLGMSGHTEGSNMDSDFVP